MKHYIEMIVHLSDVKTFQTAGVSLVQLSPTLHKAPHPHPLRFQKNAWEQKDIWSITHGFIQQV